MVFSIDLTLFIYCFLLEQELFSGCCSPLETLYPVSTTPVEHGSSFPKWHMALGAFKPHSQNSLPPPFFSRTCFFRSTPLRFLCLFLPTGSPIHCPMCVPSPAAIVLCRNTVWAALGNPAPLLCGRTSCLLLLYSFFFSKAGISIRRRGVNVFPSPKISELPIEVQRLLLNFLPIINFPKGSCPHDLKRTTT